MFNKLAVRSFFSNFWSVRAWPSRSVILPFSLLWLCSCINFFGFVTCFVGLPLHYYACGVCR